MSTITKPSRAQQRFVEGAAKPKVRAASKARASVPRKQITINVATDVLDRLDKLAFANGQTRAGLISLGIARLLRDGI
jgi:hypothetical protein